MSLLNDDLSVWEIGFRWAGYDSEQFRLRLPLLVRHNFRILIDAILCGHLYCITLDGQKYHGDDPEEARLHIRYWLDDVNTCIEGQTFSKKMLKWGRIERWECKRRCELRTVPLPEFWFPPAWALEYQWDEGTLIVSESGCRSELPAKEETFQAAINCQGNQTILDPVQSPVLPFFNKQEPRKRFVQKIE